jgi:DNA-directed RNA polymerase specialized sigma24 family protein
MRNPGQSVPPPPSTPRALGEETTQAGLDRDAAPFEVAVDHQAVQAYEAALLKLPPRDQRAVRGRFEDQQSYGSLAEALGLTTATAARAAVVRALGRLIEVMSQ